MKTRLHTVAALAATALLTAAACAPEPQSGIVTDKDYEPPSFVIHQNCTTRYDSKGRYAGQTCSPWTQHFPECWEIDYDSTDDTTEATEGEDCVSEDLYDALYIGAEYRKGMSADDVA